MNTFNIGDKVRLIRSDDRVSEPVIGTIGYVLEPHERTSCPWVNFIGWGGSDVGPSNYDADPRDITCINHDDLELVTDDNGRFIIIDQDNYGDIGDSTSAATYSTFEAALKAAQECAEEAHATYVVWKAVGEASAVITTKTY